MIDRRHSVEAYRDAVAAALADGWRFASLHATTATDGREPMVRTLLTSQEGDVRSESVSAARGSVPTIVDLAPAAGWDEREAHDLYGIGFDGHEPLRPLIDHDVPLDRFATPVHGHDPYQVAVGPVHAGVIESGHFRFHVVGDLILHVDARLFYKHRGLETEAEGLPLEDALRVVARSCAGCWVSNAVAYAQACEEALGLEPTPELARARTILLELERVWNTLNDIGAICAGVGMAAGTSRFRSARRRREAAQRAADRSPVPVRLGRSRWQHDSTWTSPPWAKPGRRSPGSAPSRRGHGRRCSSTGRSWIGCPTSVWWTPRRHARSASSVSPRAPPASPRT